MVDIILKYFEFIVNLKRNFIRLREIFNKVMIGLLGVCIVIIFIFLFVVLIYVFIKGLVCLNLDLFIKLFLIVG